MTSPAPTAQPCYAGIDTHADTHHVAVITALGAPVDDKVFPTTPAGLTDLVEWLQPHNLVVARVKGTSSYGAELTRRFAASGLTVREVTRPARSHRGTSTVSTTEQACLHSLSVLAQTCLNAHAEAESLKTQLHHLTHQLNPNLCAMTGVGPISAAQLLVTAGGNPERIRSEAAFAQLCGNAPKPGGIQCPESATSKPKPAAPSPDSQKITTP